MFRNFLITIIGALLATTLVHANQLSNYRKIIVKSQQFNKYLNTSADPCEDFYEFACGNYEKYVDDKYLEDYNFWDAFMNISWVSKLKIIQELQLNITDNDREAVVKVKKFYQSCLKISEKSEVYNEKIKELLSEFGKMPLLEGEAWQENEFDWQYLIAKIKHDADTEILLKIDTTPDYTNRTRNRLALTQPSFYFDAREAYVDKEFEEYQNYFIEEIQMNLETFLGVNKSEAQQAALEIYKLEAALAQYMEDENITPPFEYYSLVTMEEAQRNFLPTWDTRKLFRTALNQEEENIIIQSKYLKKIVEVIQNTPKRILANYIYYMYLNVYFQALTPGGQSMKKHCFGQANEYFVEVLQNMIYRRYFGKRKEEFIHKMWPYLKDTFEEILNSPRLKWMNDENTLNVAIRKLKAMNLTIDSYEEKNFDNIYKDLETSADDFLGNLRAILKIRSDKSRNELNQPPFYGPISTTTLSYTFMENTIHLPVAILHNVSPWSRSYPPSVNFGSLGFFIAHEMVHGFDDIGCHYDNLGNGRTWMDPETMKAHREHRKCFTRQYGSYTYNGKALPPPAVQAENIADNGGIHLAYKAYEKFRNSNEYIAEKDKLLGTNFTSSQLFFISFGQNMCYRQGEDYQIDSTDQHIPWNIRVKGALANFEKFAEVFNCPKGSTMNPMERCEMY